MDIYVCKLFLFCLIFCYTRQGRAAAMPITFRYSRMTSPYTNTPFLEKNYMGKKKGKKTIHTHAVRLAIPGKKVH